MKLTPRSLVIESLNLAENGHSIVLTACFHEHAPNMEPTGLHPRPPCLSTFWASRSPALLSTPRVGTSDWSSLLFPISTVGRLTLCAAAYRVSLCISEMLFSSQRAWVLQLNSFAFHSYFSKLDCKSQIWKTKIKQFLFHNNPTIFKVMSVSAELGKGDI